MINEFDDIEIKKSILSNQWAFGQLFPELMSPGPMPGDIKHKTHTFSSRFSDTVSVWNTRSFDPQTNAVVDIPERKGKLWVYFAPMNDLLNLSVMTPIGIDQSIINKNAVFFASSNGPLPTNTFGMLNHQEITMNGTAKRNLSLTGYKKIRVVSAALVIKQIGPVKERSGILKVGMGYKGAIEHVPGIVYDKFENYFNLTKIVYLNETTETICRFRLPEQMLDTYAPFDPTTSLPYFFIYGEGISTKISFEVDVVRHFEGLILPEYASFHAMNIQPPQSHINIQNDVVRAIESNANIVQNMNSNGSGSNVFSYQSVLQQNIQNPVDPVKRAEQIAWYSRAVNVIRKGLNHVAAKYRDKAKDKAKDAAIQMVTNAIVGSLSEKSKHRVRVIRDFVKSNYDPQLSNNENAAKIGNLLVNRFTEVSIDMFVDKVGKMMSKV